MCERNKSEKMNKERHFHLQGTAQKFFISMVTLKGFVDSQKLTKKAQYAFIRNCSAVYIPNSKKFALAISHWQLGIEHLGKRNTMECFA